MKLVYWANLNKSGLEPESLVFFIYFHWENIKIEYKSIKVNKFTHSFQGWATTTALTDAVGQILAGQEQFFNGGCLISKFMTLLRNTKITQCKASGMPRACFCRCEAVLLTVAATTEPLFYLTYIFKLVKFEI